MSAAWERMDSTWSKVEDMVGWGCTGLDWIGEEGLEVLLEEKEVGSRMGAEGVVACLVYGIWC